MKRQIKFRGKTTVGGIWAYGSLLQREDTTTGIVHCEICNFLNWDVVPESVGQFTGLTCKDGKEIYEGDIVSSGSTGRKYVIEYSDGKYRAKHSLIGLDIFLSAAFLHNKTVVGNIHDTPQLIK